MSLHFLPNTHRWAKICLPNSRPIFLYNAKVSNTEINGIVKVAGEAKVCVESLEERAFPRVYVDRDLPWWDPRRLFGYTTYKVSVPDIPTDFILDIEILNENLLAGRKNILVYSRYEMQWATYRVPFTCLELSP